MPRPIPAAQPGSSRRTVLRAAGLLALPALSGLARAAGPIGGGKPVTLVVSYPVGGGADLMARLVAPKLAEALGQPVIVENKPGASGQVAAQQVARATPDGTQLLFDASSYAVNPSLFPKLPYDTDAAFTPLAVVALFPNVLVCTPGFEAKTVADVIRMARASPGRIAYASSGNGSAQHLAGALFEQRAGVELLHVPYRGGGPALNDVMGGQVPLFFANVASSLGHIQSGKLRALGVTAPLRARALPAVPSIAESGVKGVEVFEWNPIVAPAGIGADTKTTLVAAIRRALGDPEVVGRIRQLSGEVFDNANESAVTGFLKAQQAQWGRLVRERKITAT